MARPQNPYRLGAVSQISSDPDVLVDKDTPIQCRVIV
jgi:hypothetical protein